MSIVPRMDERMPMVMAWWMHRGMTLLTGMPIRIWKASQMALRILVMKPIQIELL